MKKTFRSIKNKISAKSNSKLTSSNQIDSETNNQLKPTGIKVEETYGHQTLRGGFFQTRHTEKK
jgi:hypothetical protein